MKTSASVWPVEDPTCGRLAGGRGRDFTSLGSCGPIGGPVHASSGLSFGLAILVKAKGECVMS